jgi:hypothetical protein
VLGPTQREWRSDAKFTAAIQARMPHGAAIFQLPQMPFPEGYAEPVYGLEIYGAGFTTSYELMRGYLHSSGLRWSYGAMKGRPADWASELVTKPMSFAVKAAAVDGFDGLWIDLQGYDFQNRPAIKAELQKLTGEKPLVSPRRDLEFFDLRPVRAGLVSSRSAEELATLRADTLHPLRMTCTGTGLVLENPSPAPRLATLTFTLFLPTTRPRTVVMRFPGRPVRRMKVDDTGHVVSEHLALPPGRHVVKFAFAGPPAQPHSLTRGPQVYSPDISDDALRSFDNQVPGTQGPLAGKVPPNCTQTVLAVPSRVLS